MKKLFMLSFLLGIVTSCLAHMTLLFPIPRAHPLSGGSECIAGPLNKGKNPGKCAEQELKFPCGGYSPNSNIVTKLESGKTFNVSFFNLEFKDSVFFSKDQNRFLVNRDFFEKNHKNDNQGRHNGGTCEFALSYDGGKTFIKIATYRERCPDMAYDWPVKIPANAPSCKNGVDGKRNGDCIFSWTWLSSVTREFYQNCANIEIIGKTTIPLKENEITKANLPGVFDTIINVPGEKPKCASDANEDSRPGEGKAVCNARGAGPKPQDIDTNLR